MTTVRVCALWTTCALIGASVAHAQQGKAQYRHLSLADGRTVTAEVLSTEPTGLRMRTPQGVSLVAFELLLDMVPSEEGAYAAQRPWTVHVAAPPEVRDPLIDALRALPEVDVHPVEEPTEEITPAQAHLASRCALDLECVVRALEDAPWRWVVVALPDTDGGVRLVSAVTTGTTRHRAKPASLTPQDLWSSVHEILHMEVPSGQLPKAVVAPPRPAGVLEPEKVVALSFTPLPGFPSLRQGDGVGFAKALGIVAPATALWVGAVGKNAQSLPETAALGAVGFYAATVLANQVTGAASSKKRRNSKAVLR